MHLSGHTSSDTTSGVSVAILESACLVKCEAPLWNGLSACLSSGRWRRLSCLTWWRLDDGDARGEAMAVFRLHIKSSQFPDEELVRENITDCGKQQLHGGAVVGTITS